MYTRNDYIKGICSHRQYYAQFVTKEAKAEVLNIIGINKILKSKDESFNDIPLYKWDSIILPYKSKELLQKAGDFYSLAGQVCILKEIAKQIKEKGE